MISHLNQVTEPYLDEFIRHYDDFFSKWIDGIQSFAVRSAQMRSDFIIQNRSITILHRDGGFYLLRPINERLRPIEADRLPKYGFYR